MNPNTHPNAQTGSSSCTQPGARQIAASIKTKSVFVFVISASAFALYTGAVGAFQAPVQRCLFAFLTLPVIYLCYPSKIVTHKLADDLLSITLSLAALTTMGWTLLNIERLYAEPFIGHLDVFMGALGLLLVLEAVRRTIGPTIALLFAISLAFTFFGKSIPFKSLAHAGLDLESMTSTIFYGTGGVFGTPLGVTATFIVVIMILGALLTETGTAGLLMNIAKGIAGRMTGGPAKISVMCSALMGMLTGATVANVATTGTVTIPMMKKAGYPAHVAGAVEALASSGGQLMPPIMGAAAFVMIEYLNIPYSKLVTHAILPAALYFMTVLVIIHLRSKKNAIQAIDPDQIPNPWRELKKRGHMLIPIAVLVGMLTNKYGVMYSSFVSVACAILVCQFRPDTRLGLRGYYRAFESAIVGLCPLVAITAGAGILIGVLGVTGLTMKISFVINEIAQGRLIVALLFTMLACIVLGMGLPTVAAYVVLATLVPASLIELGVLPIQAHMFIFYFAVLSAITPPVCTGAYVAAGIAKADPVITAFEALRMGLIVFVLPFAFVFDARLLMIGDLFGVMTALIFGIIGIAYWAFGLEGYLRGELSWPSRVILLIAGVMAFTPFLWAKSTGLVLGGMVAALAIRLGPEK